jgi:hypothetical protein
MAEEQIKRPRGRPPGKRDKSAEAYRILKQHELSVSRAVRMDIAKMSPLQVMLHAMSLEAEANRWPNAAKIAKEAAPYVHPRLSSVTMNANFKRSIVDLSDEELVAFAATSASDGGDDEEADGA